MGWFSELFRRKSASTALARSSREPQALPDMHGGNGAYIVKTVSDVYGENLAKITNQDPSTLTIYEASVWAFTCARLISITIASIPLGVEINGEPAPDTDLLVKLLSNPAEKWSYNRFAQSSALYQTLTGSAYWQKVRLASQGKSEAQVSKGKNKPGELWPFGQDSYSTTIKTPGRPVVDYYTDKDGNDQEPDDVMQALYVKPGAGNEGGGASPAKAASKEAQADVKAAEWNDNALNNRMVPDGIFKIKVAPVSKEQYAESEQRIKTAYQGAQKARTPMVLGEEVDWIALARNAIEMDFINGRKLTRETICAAYGVPPVLVGILDHATYSNYDVAQEVFWTLTILPLLNIWLDVLNAELAPEFGPDHKIRADTSQVAALLRLVEKRWTLAEKMLNRGVPMDQVNKNLSLGLSEFAGWDVGLVPANLIPIDTFVGGE